MPTRVAFVTSFPENPERPHGGVEAVSVNLVSALVKTGGLEIHVVTTDRDCHAPSQMEWSGATIHRLPWEGRTVLRHATGPGRRCVQAYLTRLAPEVIHAHDFYGIMVKGLAIPRVFTIHGFIYGDTLVSHQKLAWLRSKLWYRVETAAWADQPHIISISPYVRERVSPIARGMIHDIDNPISPSFFDIARRERKGVIFSAAVISPRKNPLALVEAVGQLAADGIEVELRLAGPVIHEAYGRRLQERVQALRLQDRVKLLGQIDTTQVREELARASVFALVSLEENSPMGVEEAMAAGVPVVTSNRCGMPYMVRDGETGCLVDPHDPGDIAERLCEVLGDDGLRARMGARAKEVARDRFHPDAVARRTRHVYERAIRDGRRHRR